MNVAAAVVPQPRKRGRLGGHVVMLREGDRQLATRSRISKENIRDSSRNLLAREEVGNDGRDSAVPRQDDSPRARDNDDRVWIRRSDGLDELVLACA